MTERMLIPLDGSKVGEAALYYIARLLDKLEPGHMPEIILFHVVQRQIEHINVEGGVVDIYDSSQDIESVIASAMIYLNKSAETLIKKGATVTCKIALNDTGASSAEKIIDAETELNIDMVAMSTHGRRGISRWAYGSVTGKVLSSGHVPVLMVRVKKDEL